MQSLPKFSILSFALCCAFASGNALADKQVSATITNVSYRLIDLDENDGITPSISFSDPHAYDFFRMSTYHYDRSQPDDNVLLYGGAQDLNPFTSNFSYDFGGSTTQHAGGLFGDLTLDSALHNQGFIASFEHATEINRTFQMSANTALEFSFHTTAGFYSSNGSYASNQSGYVDTGLAIYDAYQNDYYQRGVSSFISGSPEITRSAEADYTFRFNNVRDQAANGRVSLYVGFNASDSGLISAVPEPETWGMMLGGLSLLAAYARRRQQRGN